MLHSAQIRLQAIREEIGKIAPDDHKLRHRLNLVYLELMLSRLFERPSDSSYYFKKFCTLLGEQIELLQGCMIDGHELSLPPRLIYYLSRGRKPEVVPGEIMKRCMGKVAPLVVKKLPSGDLMACTPDPESQFLFIVPVMTGEGSDLRLGHLLFWCHGSRFLNDYKRLVRTFAGMLAAAIVRRRGEKVQAHLAAASQYESDQVKKVIQKVLTSLQATLGCDYSVALVLKRAITDLNNNPARAGVQNYEVVTEYLKGKAKLARHRSKATGLWIEESEGLLALALALWERDPRRARKGMTFHQQQPGGREYLCLETGQVGISLRGSEEEAHERVLHYAPLIHDRKLIGCIKVSYRQLVQLTELDRSIIMQYADLLAMRISHSFIYSLTVEQTRFLQQIKSMFEGTDRLEARNFDELGKFLLELTGNISQMTHIDTVAIGYLTKDMDGERVLRFPHPRGWDPAAENQYKELPVSDGLAGLAVRTRRNVFLVPVEEPTTYSDPEPTVYVDENRSRFVDIRKHPDYLGQGGYTKLSSYYIKVREEKVYANYIFVIEYKNIVLGVIDLEVAHNSWDRFMGIGYLLFFRTLASMLALLFFRVRLGEEHTRMVQAVKWLSDAVYKSPQAVVRTVLGMLHSIYGVEKAKIIPGDILKDPIEITVPQGGVEKYRHLFIGYSEEDMERFAVPGDRIDPDNMFLMEFRNHLQQSSNFFLHIPDIDEYEPQLYDRQHLDKFARFRRKPRFKSYLALLLGEKSRGVGVLELVSTRINAFDDLLIDLSFVETWTSQMSMAIKVAMHEEHREESSEPGAAPGAAAAVVVERGKVVPFVPEARIESGYNLVGRGRSMARLRDLIRQAAQTVSMPILIVGESGTGKELVALAIHRESNWAKDRFITQDCGAFSNELIADALFGHVRGAYTSATEERKGLFESANGGTLFLDEISNMSHELQGKFLRVLEDGRVTPLGSTKSVQVQVQILAATNADLDARIRSGDFRHDLYYRLSAFTIETVTLRRMIQEDPGNLLLLISYFAARQKELAAFTGITRKSLDFLLEYDFPGNVRQLRHAIARAAYSARGESVLDISPDLFKERAGDPPEISEVAFREPAEKFLRKLHRIGINHHSPEKVAAAIARLQHSREGDLKRIQAFLTTFEAIDVPIAALLSGVGATWARRMLKDRLNLRLHPQVNLWFSWLP